jgi:hypothetical protein
MLKRILEEQMRLCDILRQNRLKVTTKPSRSLSKNAWEPTTVSAIHTANDGIWHVLHEPVDES